MPAKKPSKILELTGAFKKDPQRKNHQEPEGKGEFNKDPPAHLTNSQKTHWHEIIGLVPDGVLTGSDVLQVEIVVGLLDMYREEKGRVHVSVIQRLTSEMGKLGLDPAARAKLQIDKKKVGEFDDF